MNRLVRRPVPPGHRLVFVTAFRHWRTKKIIRASDYGKRAFRVLRSRSLKKMGFPEVVI